MPTINEAVWLRGFADFALWAVPPRDRPDGLSRDPIFFVRITCMPEGH
jgi:hypothetical protein